MVASALTFFHAFKENLAEGVHNLQAHTLKAYLTNAVPNVTTHAVKTDIAEIAAGNGYTAGGATVTISSSAQTGGTYKNVSADVTITAAGGNIGPFQRLVIYNDTPTSPVDPLIGFYDYGSAITLTDGESLTLDLDQVAGMLTLA